MRVANGSRAMFRACLMARVRRRWCVVQTPVSRRGTILPRSATNALQQAHVAVGNRVDLLGAELADLLAAEELAAAAGSAAGTAAGRGRSRRT